MASSSRGGCGIECVRRQGALCPLESGLNALPYSHQAASRTSKVGPQHLHGKMGLGDSVMARDLFPMDPGNSAGGCHVQMSNAAQLIFNGEEGWRGHGRDPRFPFLAWVHVSVSIASRPDR